MAGLYHYRCPICKKLLAIIPTEFTSTFRTPCKSCQGWEIKHNFDLYLLKFDQTRFAEYQNLNAKLFPTSK